MFVSVCVCGERLPSLHTHTHTCVVEWCVSVLLFVSPCGVCMFVCVCVGLPEVSVLALALHGHAGTVWTRAVWTREEKRERATNQQ